MTSLVHPATGEVVDVHPAADLLPAPTTDEYGDLVADIATFGLRHPIVRASDGRLLDGRNRLRACWEAHVEPSFTVFDGDPIAYVLSTNVTRRHLTPSQRAAVAAEAVDLYAAEAKQRMLAGKKADPGPDRDQGSDRNARRATAKAAKATGASRTSTAKAKRVKDHAPDLHEKVKAGAITVDAAEKQVQIRELASLEANITAAIDRDIPGAAAERATKQLRARVSKAFTAFDDLLAFDPDVVAGAFTSSEMALWRASDRQYREWADRLFARRGLHAVEGGR